MLFLICRKESVSFKLFQKILLFDAFIVNNLVHECVWLVLFNNDAELSQVVEIGFALGCFEADVVELIDVGQIKNGEALFEFCWQLLNIFLI